MFLTPKCNVPYNFKCFHISTSKQHVAHPITQVGLTFCKTVLHIAFVLQIRFQSSVYQLNGTKIKLSLCFQELHVGVGYS
jgi:hypothetical protein